MVIEAIETAGQHGVDEGVLAAEVIVHRGEIRVCTGGNVAQRHGFIAGVDIQGFGGIEEARLGVP